MFGLPWRKRKISFERHSNIAPIYLDWFAQCLIEHEGLHHPDWEPVYKYADENLSNEEPNELWCNIARNWMSHLADRLPHDYYRTESDHFILISSREYSFNKSLLIFLERCRKRLLSIANGILRDEGDGKYVVIAFADVASYYDYTSFFGPSEGVFGLSSGMFIDNGYGHFVFFASNLDEVEPIAAHEMTHALLRHLSIPLWLDEGMAVNMESMITGIASSRVNNAVLDQHTGFWNTQTIQEFWQGKSFSRPDEGQSLSYQLAQIMVSTLSKDYEPFAQFVNTASWEDGGEAACKNVYGFGVGDIAASFLGEGDWASVSP